MRLTIWTDGGSRGNPGPAAAGVVICDSNGTRLFGGGFYLGKATNNVAEYTGLLRALEQADRLGGTELKIFCDSDLLVKQITGQYRVKNAALKALYADAMAMIRTFDKVDIRHVYREDNTEADSFVNDALDINADSGDAVGSDLAAIETPHADPGLFESPNDSAGPFLDVEQLRERASFDSAKAQRILLSRDGGLFSGLICLEPRQKHRICPQWSQATMIVMSGTGTIAHADEEFQLQPGTWLRLGPGDGIEIAAAERLVVLLTAQE